MPSTSPFLASPCRIISSVSGCIRMQPVATATRRVSCLPPTSTMWACPASLKCVNSDMRDELLQVSGYHSRVKKIYLLLLLCTPLAMADGLPDLGEVAQTVMTPLDEQRIGEEIMRE